MNRRDFLKRASVGIAGVAVAPHAALHAAQPNTMIDPLLSEISMSYWRFRRMQADLASAYAIPLEKAKGLVEAVFEGDTFPLSRYGIMVDEKLPKPQKFEAALKAIDDQVDGAAELHAQTFAGDAGSSTRESD